MFRGVPRFSEAFRGVPRRSREASLLPPLVAGMLTSGSPRPPKVFRGVPRPRNASKHLGTPRNTYTSGGFGLPDLSIPGTNGGGAAFATVSGWNA